MEKIGILLIDNKQLQRYDIQDCLHKAGYKTELAVDGSTGALTFDMLSTVLSSQAYSIPI